MSFGFLLIAQRRVWVAVLLLATLAGACSAEDRRASAVGLEGGTPRKIGAPCDAGQSQACSITLSQKAGVLECYHGTQTCEDGRWGACSEGVVTEQAALAAPHGLQQLALSEPADCESNPCNPFCRWFNEVPSTPVGGGNDFDWDTGSLSDLPGSVVQAGLDQPCQTARDCQFNTRCQNPSPGSCAHNVCQSGIALTSECSECASLVYDVAEQYPDAYGQCFGLPPDPTAEDCVHDPCAVGGALKTNCDASVAQVCAGAAFASCCQSGWTSACVDRFRELFPNACQCGPGEVLRDGNCLSMNPAYLGWEMARDTCRGRGDGWDLAWIEDSAENAYVFDTWGPDGASSTDPDALWIGLNDRAAEASWQWSGGALSGVWDQDTSTPSPGMYLNWCGRRSSDSSDLGDCVDAVTQPSQTSDCAGIGGAGAWYGLDCNTELPSLCKGPPLHSQGSQASSCASAGQYFTDWEFFAAGAETQTHSFGQGQYTITVVARGDYAGGEWPEMQFTVGTGFSETVTVDDANWKSFSFDVEVDSADDLAMTVTFLNDFYESDTVDRNLYVDSITVQCEGLASAPPAWGDQCIGIAKTACDVSCDSEQVTVGACVPWLPGETDPDCPDKPDLSLGVPCTGTIPVCNHGQVEAPAGVNVVFFRKSAGQFGLPNPDLGLDGVVSCATSEPIPPGRCISLSEEDCSTSAGQQAGLYATGDLMVNPPGQGAVEECSNLDNWAIYVDSVECGAPACFGGSTAATSVRRPVDIVFVIDNSASMQEEIQQVQQRINEDFASIIEASGLDFRVIMVSRYGDVTEPFGSGGGGTSYPICIGPPLGTTACADPNNEVPVPGERFFHYSARVGSNDALCLLLDGLSAPDELAVQDRPGWQVQAPGGYGAWLRPEAFKTFVVITDDDVQCTTSGNLSFDDSETVNGGVSVANDFDAALRTIAPGQFENDAGERDYIWHSIINIEDNVPADQPWPADADISTTLCTGPPGPFVGPGTGYQALSRLTGGLRYPSCRTSDFDAVFNAIAQNVIDGSALSCTFELDATGIDLDAARVSYMPSSGDKMDLTEVAEEGDCTEGGWYLEPGERTLSLCPETCAEVQGDAGAQVFVEFGCETATEPVTRTEIYQADCAQGSIIEWRALGYDTTVTDDGSVQFQVRTAPTMDELDDASFVPVNTATSQAPDCLYLKPMECVPEDTDCTCTEGVGGGVALSGDKLDPVESRQEYLELQIAVLPGSSGTTLPSVTGWKVAYSCLPGE